MNQDVMSSNILTEEQNKLIADLLETVKTNEQLPAVTEESLVFEYKNVTYKHIVDSETFDVQHSVKPITALAVMKEAEPELTRSMYRKIVPPKELYLFGKATRKKLIRLAQLYYNEPPINDFTRAFVPFFEYLTNSKLVGNHFAISQYYKASLWATQYDEQLASSLMLYYGWPPDFGKIKMAGTSIHQIIRHPEGIQIIVSRPHTFQDRFNKACSVALLESCRNFPAPTKERLLEVAFPAFYCYNNTFVSMTSDMHEVVHGKLQAFIEDLVNPLCDVEPTIPDIFEPEDFIPDQNIYLPFSDFLFLEEATVAQKEQRKNNNINAVCSILLTKLSHLEVGKPIKRKDLLKFISDENMSSGLKHGYLSKPKYGHYAVTAKLFEKG